MKPGEVLETPNTSPNIPVAADKAHPPRLCMQSDPGPLASILGWKSWLLREQETGQELPRRPQNLGRQAPAPSPLPTLTTRQGWSGVVWEICKYHSPKI